MSFLATGTAADYPTLLELFITYAVSHGWTAYRFGASSGDPVQFSRLSGDGTFTHYYNMDQGTNPIGVAWTGIIINASTGSDTGLAWNNQPGKHPYTGGADLSTTTNLEYYFFSDGFSVGMSVKKAISGFSRDVWALAVIGFHKNTRAAFGSTGYQGTSNYWYHRPLGSNGNASDRRGLTQVYSSQDSGWLLTGNYTAVGGVPGEHSCYDVSSSALYSKYDYPGGAALGALGSDSVLDIPVLSPHRIVKNSIAGYRTLDSVSEFTYFVNTKNIPDGFEITVSSNTYVCFPILRGLVTGVSPFDLGIAFKTS